MIENYKISTTKDLLGFVITSISDADLRAKVQEIPDLLEKKDFSVADFIGEMKENLNESPSAELQNDAMLFIELLLKGSLTVKPKQLNELSEMIK